MEIRLNDLRAGYHDLVGQVREEGSRVTVRGQETRELTGVTIRVANPANPMLPVGVGRNVNAGLAAVEALQLIGGYDAQDLLVKAAPQYSRVLVDPQDLAYGAYGPRIETQLVDAYHLLATDPTTRQAVIEIWKAGDLTHDGDKPCTLSLQFLLRERFRNRYLEMIVNMRSQDVWLGVPYDLFMFTQLQWTFARLLGAYPGPYVHHVASLHLYERDVAASGGLFWPSESVDLPFGIVSYASAVPRMPQIAPVISEARSILRNPDVDPGESLNPWYAREIAKVYGKEVVS